MALLNIHRSMLELNPHLIRSAISAGREYTENVSFRDDAFLISPSAHNDDHSVCKKAAGIPYKQYVLFENDSRTTSGVSDIEKSIEAKEDQPKSSGKNDKLSENVARGKVCSMKKVNRRHPNSIASELTDQKSDKPVLPAPLSKRLKSLPRIFRTKLDKNKKLQV